MANLNEFARDVWTVQGPDVRDMGVMFTTRMTIVRLSDGTLWVDSPVPVQFETLKQITDLGSVRHLVAGTPRHVWRLEGWHKLFPGAQLWSARPSLFTVGKAVPPLTNVLDDFPPQGWETDLDQLAFKGSPLIEEILFFHKKSRTVILDDLIQIHPMAKARPFQNLLLKLEGVAFPHGGVGLDIKLTFTHRDLARQSLKKLLAWDFDKLIIAHGDCIEEDAKPFVERAFRWLAR